MKIAFDSAMDHQLEPVARVREVAMAAISKLPVSGSGQGFLAGLFPPSEIAVLDPGLALDAVNAIRGRDSDPEMAPLAALERPAASTRAADETGGLDLSIEMETGTGKTYTYLRTIFELAQSERLPDLHPRRERLDDPQATGDRPRRPHPGRPAGQPHR